MTDRARWREIDAVFQQALELDPGEWAGFLERRCGHDAALGEAVRELLAADEGAERFLQDSVDVVAPDEVQAALRTATDPGIDRTGERVGAFRVVRQIGRGGMASVFEATRADGEFSQRVAIKFPRRGLDTEDFVRRFLAERDILSSLTHPNIARLIDGGTTARDLPYLALEYVDGLPITKYCAENRCTLEQRLRLFVQVARAVQHAHGNLVVHRDIKPSNILVTRDGQVKLLDFGIAKLLSPEPGPRDAPLTRTGTRPFTPEYASPEQVRGDSITTASDVYQLGILLFRLLTGERPYEWSGSASRWQEVISEAPPIAPSEAVRAAGGNGAQTRSNMSSASALSRRLRGDLDTIVLKALRKAPLRRYATASEMADDVGLHLAGRPITARRESSLYRTGKLLKRHVWIAPVSIAAVALAAAYLVTLVQHGRELESERNVARDVQQAFVSFFTAPDSVDTGLGEGRRDLTILEAIRDGSDQVRRDLADRPAARAELLGAMARVLQDLDETTQAYELASEALALERDLYGPESLQVHETLLLVGGLSTDSEMARRLLEERLALSSALYGRSAPETAISLQALANLDISDGRLEDGVARLEAAVEIYRDGSVPQWRLAEALADLVDGLEPLDRADEAVVAAREGYEILRAELGERHSRTATAGARLAQALTAAGRYQEARPTYEASLAAMDAELGATHSTTMASRNNYAIVLRLDGDAAAAEGIFRELLEAQRTRYGPVDVEIASTLQNMATTIKTQERYEEAERTSRAAHEMFVATRGSEYFQAAYPLLSISEIRLILEDYTGAEEASRRALDILRANLPSGHFATAVAECRVGEALAGQGRRSEAREFLESGAGALLSGDRREVDPYRDACLAALEAL
jgi:serine/threonine-protein kinase